MDSGPASSFVHRVAFVPPGIGASSFLMTMTYKRCRQRQGATSSQCRGSSNNMMMLLRHGVLAAAAGGARKAYVPWHDGSAGDVYGVHVVSPGERQHDRVFMFLNEKHKMASSERDGSAEASVASPATEVVARATPDERRFGAREYYGGKAAATLSQRGEKMRRASRISSSKSTNSITERVPRGRSSGDPLGGGGGGGGRRTGSLARTFIKSQTTTATDNSDDGGVPPARAPNELLLRGASCGSSSSSRKSRGGKESKASDSTAPAAVPGGIRAASSGRARRQRDRRRRERAIMAAKKSLVRKVKELGATGRWREAIAEVESAIEDGLPPDQHLYGSCVGAAANSGKWEEALDILRRMRKCGVVPTTPVYNAAIKACARGGKIEIALALLREMRSNAARLVADGDNSAAAEGSPIGQAEPSMRRAVGGGMEGGSPESDLNGAGDGAGRGSRPSDGGSSRSSRARRKTATPSCDPDIQTINTVMSACAGAGMWELALEVMARAQQDGLHPTRVTYNTAISACGRGEGADQAVRLLREMRRAGLVPDAVSFNSTIAACANEGQWKRALSVLAEFEAIASDKDGAGRRVGPRPDSYSFSSAIAACGRGGQWSLALGLLSTMRRKGIAPGVVAFNAAISACGKAGQWERALGLLRDMEAEAAERSSLGGGNGDGGDGGGDDGFSGPDRVSYNAAMYACSNAGEWQQALSLLAEMRRKSLGAATGGADDDAKDGRETPARSDGQQRRHRLQPRAQDRRAGWAATPDVVSYTTAIAACSRVGNWERAFDLLHQMLDDGIAPNSATFTTMIAAWRKDWGYGGGDGEGRGAGRQEPRDTLLPLLDKMNACGIAPDKRLYGAALGACADALLCQRARSLLAEMVASGIPADGTAHNAVATACAAVGRSP